MTTENSSRAEPHASANAEHSAFGDVEVVPLSRIQKIAATRLSHSWSTIPHVTHHNEVDVTELESLRSTLELQTGKLSTLSFVVKATVCALQDHSRFNSSLDDSGENLIIKKYFNVGVAIDTPAGLVVGVVRDCERKGVSDIAAEIARLSRKARKAGLSLAEMSGGSFTVSSLGGLTGTTFTPIIRAPEVAILGVAKAQWKASRGEDQGIEWRLMLPLSLSYDHRAVNGAEASRLIRSLAHALTEPRRLVTEEARIPGESQQD